MNDSISDNIESTKLYGEVMKLVRKHCDISRDTNVGMDSHFRNDLSIDSLAFVETVMDIENIFGVIIVDEDAEKIETIKDLVVYLIGKLGKDSDWLK